MLFNELVFGPIKSRRLGTSLGINLLPTNSKLCNFNCVYCECGWNEKEIQKMLHPMSEVISALESKLQMMQKEQKALDSITFSGNGEPTIHPEFPPIISEVIRLRNQYYPNAKITVLTNSTQLHKKRIFESLLTIDNPILKLDAGSEKMYHTINRINTSTPSFETILSQLIEFGDRGIIQTLLLRGEHNGERIDNTSEEEFGLYLGHLKKIRPKYVMLYAIDRETPEQNLEKLTTKELDSFAKRIENTGIKVLVFG